MAHTTDFKSLPDKAIAMHIKKEAMFDVPDSVLNLFNAATVIAQLCGAHDMTAKRGKLSSKVELNLIGDNAIVGFPAPSGKSNVPDEVKAIMDKMRPHSTGGVDMAIRKLQAMPEHEIANIINRGALHV